MTVLVLFVVGIVGLLVGKRTVGSRYGLFLLLNLVAAPVASALTITNAGHVTRSMGLGLLILIISGYGFMVALLLGPVVGHRGLSSRGPIAAKLVYSGNLLGAITSLFGTVALLHAAWLNL